MSVLTRKMNDAVRSHKMREDLDNTWESEPSRSLFPDTSIELELRELLVIAISISSLAMQHVNTNGAKCGHPDLISKFRDYDHVKHVEFKDEVFFTFNSKKTGYCLHTNHLRQDILQFNLDHIDRIGIPRDPKSKDYQPVQSTYHEIGDDKIQSFPFDPVTSLTSMYNLALAPLNVSTTHST